MEQMNNMPVIKEWEGKRVVTLKDIDRVHNRQKGTARRNFNNNKKHFIVGVDYIIRNSYEAKQEYNILAPNGVTLLTESGYLIIAKSFTEKEDLVIQQAMLEVYFVKNEHISDCEKIIKHESNEEITMEGNMTIFSNTEFGEVRTVVIDNEPWFVGKDVAEALRYSDTNKAVATHVEDADKKLNDKSSPSFGQRGATLINESGLYALIFGSKLESAKRFKHWVTSEVLPAIRKTGSYSMIPKQSKASPVEVSVKDIAARITRKLQVRSGQWYYDLMPKIWDICTEVGVSEQDFQNMIILEMFDSVDWDTMIKAYAKENAKPAQRLMDVVAYFPELREMFVLTVKEIHKEFCR